jgi:hypothetical protein
MEYRSRLPVGSGMGLTTPPRNLLLSSPLVKRFDNYMQHILSSLSSTAFPGDEFSADDIFPLYLHIMREKGSAAMPGVDRRLSFSGASDPVRPQPTCARSANPRLSSVRARTRRRDAPVHPRVTFVLRRIQCLEELVRCWRDGNASTGCLFALRLLQTAEGRKRLIPGYVNSWWVALRHKDSLARYKVVIKEIVRMAPDALCAFERGTDVDWTEAISLFRAKWDDGAGSGKNTITKYLARFRDERSG